jgi:hypothetical protein
MLKKENLRSATLKVKDAIVVTCISPSHHEEIFMNQDSNAPNWKNPDISFLKLFKWPPKKVI